MVGKAKVALFVYRTYNQKCACRLAACKPYFLSIIFILESARFLYLKFLYEKTKNFLKDRQRLCRQSTRRVPKK